MTDRYQDARETFYTEESLERLLEDYRAELTVGNAAAREMERWDYSDFDMEIEQIRAFFGKRIETLDNWLGK